MPQQIPPLSPTLRLSPEEHGEISGAFNPLRLSPEEHGEADDEVECVEQRAHAVHGGLVHKRVVLKLQTQTGRVHRHRARPQAELKLYAAVVLCDL